MWCCTRDTLGTEGQAFAQGGSKRLSPGDRGLGASSAQGCGVTLPAPLFVSISSSGETGSISSYVSSKASRSSEPRRCQHMIEGIGQFKHRNDSKPLPGEKSPCSQPASSQPSLFLVQLGLSQEGIGQIPLRMCGVCDSAVIALCDNMGFAGGGVPCGPCSPLLCGCCALRRGAGCLVRTASPAYCAWGRGLYRTPWDFHRPKLSDSLH